MIGLIEPGTGFVTSALVSRVAGAAALGYSEAARVVAWPLIVLCWGLSAVLGPRSVRAAQSRELGAARRTSGLFLRILTLAGLGLLLFSSPWAGNPLGWLLPTAYVVEGLVLVTILALLADGLAYPYRSELLGAGREPALVRVEVAANVARLVVAAAARELHAFALPIGLWAAGTIRLLGVRRALRRVYAA
jgi:O-antigen/teichoic acid export membrane protein